MSKKTIAAAAEPVFDIFAAFATDEAAEVEGVKMPLTPTAGLIVARGQNDNYNRRITELYEKNRAIIDAGGEIGEALDEEVGIKALAETVLLGVYGTLNFQGKKMVYNPVNAAVWLKVKDFRRQVVMFANNIENYRIKAEGADKEN